ncbi:hypothetical protein [Sedimenticola thiotaurini]|uniref:Uncharacterized protein n=1 Tax=Sedimenticola thiotaurini TaxID=1543721 RepID=A0A0F7JT47_9GAMM|nr:hypothetical protein [Sedimenticola thiotaurini]AKH19611.1 hypothetical protein AAY24_03710 [Sedimenticola thiotaurini]
MKKFALIIAISTLLLSGCGTDEQNSTGNVEKSSMEKAAEHAKASAKELGNAVSESTESAREKWSEMNQDRHEAPTGEQDSLPKSEKADMEAIKEKYEEVKQATIEKTEEVVDKVKEMAQPAE